MARPKLTAAETRIVERYVSVLDFVSRVAGAIEGGNWHYLYEKADQLEDAAGRLAETAAANYTAIVEGKPVPRGEVVRTAVAEHGCGYRAGRLLHPVQTAKQSEGGAS